MKKFIASGLWTIWACIGQAQSEDSAHHLKAALISENSERARIGAERAQAESVFLAQESDCYRKFLVNKCLDEIKVSRREVLGDLKRQEISLDAGIRMAKGADQIRMTEDKASLANQQEKEARRVAALKNSESRLDRERSKQADRLTLQSNEKPNQNNSISRIKSSQEKVSAQTAKQASAPEEVKKFNDRQEKATQRQARHDRDQLNQTQPATKSLPLLLPLPPPPR